MPHSTQAYPFEWKVLSFAAGLSTRLTGRDFQGFVMALDEEGGARAVSFEPPEGGWAGITGEMDRAGTPYLFYDPFDGPAYTWLSWKGIDRTVMERLLGEPFADGDFTTSAPPSSRTPALDPPGQFPSAWGVMF